jgi:hypothetical protein
VTYAAVFRALRGFQVCNKTWTVSNFALHTHMARAVAVRARLAAVGASLGHDGWMLAPEV